MTRQAIIRIGAQSLLPLLLLLPGCGYRVGSIMHPQVQTIAIAKVVNDSLAYNAAADLRNLLSEQFMIDGSMKVVSEKTADCIVYARIVEAQFREVTKRSYSSKDEIFIPDEWEAMVKVEFSIVIPGRREPLVPATMVTGRANFQSPGDMESSSRNGIRQACREAARALVVRTTEAW